MKEMPPATPLKKEQPTGSVNIELDPAQKDFLEEKMKVYKERMDLLEEHLNQYLAPEGMLEISQYYDSVAKWTAAKLVLSGKAKKEDVSVFVHNTAREFWQEKNSQVQDANIPGSSVPDLEQIMKRQEAKIERAVDTAWAIVEKYNLGERTQPGSNLL